MASLPELEQIYVIFDVFRNKLDEVLYTCSSFDYDDFLNW